MSGNWKLCHMRAYYQDPVRKCSWPRKCLLPEYSLADAGLIISGITVHWKTLRQGHDPQTWVYGTHHASVLKTYQFWVRVFGKLFWGLNPQSLSLLQKLSKIQELRPQKAKLFQQFLILALISTVYKPFNVGPTGKEVEISWENITVIQGYRVKGTQDPYSLVMQSLLMNTHTPSKSKWHLFLILVRNLELKGRGRGCSGLHHNRR